MSKAKIDLITDENISKRYAKANNKYKKDYNPNIESSYIVYFDVNSLYSKAQTYKLPVGDFKMLTRQELDEMQKDHSKIKSCILELDLIVPDDKKFHDYTKDFPLAP